MDEALRRPKRVAAVWVILVVLVLAVVSCGDTEEATPTAVDSSQATVLGPAAEPSTTVSSTETAAPAGDVVLLSDGLGIVSFGERADVAVSRVIDALGRQPTGDFTASGDMPYGFGGPDATVRFVDFGGLSLTFTDWGYYRDDREMHFAGWGFRSLEGTGLTTLTTPEGITVGSTVEGLQNAFGGRVHLEQPNECSEHWHFIVSDTYPPINAPELWGALSGPPTDRSTSVTWLSAGAQSSC